MALLRVRKPNGEIVEIASLPGAKGEKGDVGPQGEVGYTPIKGVDYFTDEEQAAMVDEVQQYVDAQLGDVETALDSIIAIQESLINGPLIKFTIATLDDQQGSIVYYAKEGMTWAEWCGSEYNTIGAFIHQQGFVVTDSYGRMWMTGGDPEQGTNTIIDQAKYYMSTV